MSNIFYVDPYYQFRGKNSRLNVGGSIAIYDRNTSDFSDVFEADGETVKENPFKIDNNGRAAFKLDERKTYRMEVKDIDNKLLWTCGLDQNGIVDVQTFYDTVEELSGQLPSFVWTDQGEVSGIGTISGGVSAIFGGDSLRTVFHDDTLSGDGTSASPLGVSPLTELAVDETMTAYEAEGSLVLGVNQEFLKDELDKKQDVLEFGYNEDKIISINSSALSAGATYEAGENIDITDEVISVTGKKALQADETISVTRTDDSVILGVNTDTIATKEDVADKATVDYVDTKTDRLGERIDSVEDALEEKEDKLEFGYTDGKISSINTSALYGNAYNAGKNIEIDSNNNISLSSAIRFDGQQSISQITSNGMAIADANDNYADFRSTGFYAENADGSKNASLGSDSISVVSAKDAQNVAATYVDAQGISIFDSSTNTSNLILKDEDTLAQTHTEEGKNYNSKIQSKVYGDDTVTFDNIEQLNSHTTVTLTANYNEDSNGVIITPDDIKFSETRNGETTSTSVKEILDGAASKEWVESQGYLKEHQSLADYYKKTETSGASEIADALDNKQNNLTFSYVEI